MTESNEDFLKPGVEELIGASKRIKPFIHKTPVLTSATINRISGASVFFKCENFQKAGAFKMRGALNALLLLSPDSKKNGVATHSSGNHGQAVALAAKLNNIKSFIVMPENASYSKKAAIIDYGGEVIFCEPTQIAREKKLEEIVQKTGAAFIHPYNNLDVISGQATVAMELLEEIPLIDYLIAPVGGGGLLSGTVLASRYFHEKTKVIGGEPRGADDAVKSLQAGKIVRLEKPTSIADGLLSALGPITFNIIKKLVHEIYTVEDHEIIAAMKMIWERMKIIVEPSSAVPLAVLLKNKEEFVDKHVGIILTGGNVDLNNLPF